ncbi:hypothetical protein [Planomonospora algeriensis]
MRITIEGTRAEIDALRDRTLVIACGGHPLPLPFRMVGARLLRDPYGPAHRLVADLLDQREAV